MRSERLCSSRPHFTAAVDIVEQFVAITDDGCSSDDDESTLVNLVAKRRETSVKISQVSLEGFIKNKIIAIFMESSVISVKCCWVVYKCSNLLVTSRLSSQQEFKRTQRFSSFS